MTHRRVLRSVFGFLLLVCLSLSPVAAKAAEAPAKAGPTCTDSSTIQTGTTRTLGTLGQACYEITMPTTGWNKALVVYNHGYVAPLPGTNIALPDIHDLRDGLVAQGYAVAFSSYSQIGYAVKAGILDSHALTLFFAKKFGKPTLTYAIGHSMGGDITMGLVEKYPKLYQAALPMCGVVGSWSAEINYTSTFRVILGVYYQRVVGTPLDPMQGQLDPTGHPYNALNPSPALEAEFAGSPSAMQTALFTHFFDNGGNPNTPTPEALEISRITGVPADIASFYLDLLLDVFGAQDGAAKAGGNAFDNSNVLYITDDGTDADYQLNRDVERFVAKPSAAKFLAQNYTTTGKATIPILSIHTTNDPLVPLAQEGLYRAKANAAGHSANNAFQYDTNYGHCNFTTKEELYAFNELATWVANPNSKPADDADITSQR